MQLIAGRTAQQFNQRKNRKGAFWEDRYHATAVQTGLHLARCMVYIDLNMVRAGVVQHPAGWAHGGYREIQEPKKRYRMIDAEQLASQLGIADGVKMRQEHRMWIKAALAEGAGRREPCWTEGVAVGDPEYLEVVRQSLSKSNPGRRIEHQDGYYQLCEEPAVYMAYYWREIDLLGS